MKTTTGAPFHTSPGDVLPHLRRWLLVDGFELVLDLERSRGVHLHDALTGSDFLDLFAFFGSQPLGYNHPGMTDPAFRERLLQAALVKPSNSDVYTQGLADFVDAMARTLPDGFLHLFFVEGGALAVENALKAAFDWKVRKNLAAGRGELGSQVIHFERAFHGRSGYTLSLTNTFDPRKIQYFPKFPWPRITTPGIREDVDAEAQDRREDQSLQQIHAAIAAHPHDIAALLIETIQGEGGDVHFRPQFLQELRRICDAEEIILIFDEVQTGMGITGTWWAFEQLGVRPDIFAFGKKSQTCGIAATGRLDEIDGVFKVSSRINSTWGGNLVDMVRATRYIEIIEQERLLENARTTGAELLARLKELATDRPDITNPRGRGLMCAFDLPDTRTRDALRKRLLAERVIMLACGERSLRFRPVLDFSPADVALAMARIRSALENP